MTGLVLGVLLPAHGVGTRKDLPVPFGLALAGAAVALLVSFVALALLWRTPRLRGAAAGRPLPERLASGLDAGWFRWALRGLGLVATTYFLLGLLVGPDDGLNPSAGVVYVLFWVGTLAFASALLGPVWRQLNPWRTVHLIVCRVLVHDPAKGLVVLPRWVGQWPAAVALFSFAWLELVGPERATTHVLRIYVGLYALWVVAGAVVFGDRWMARADGFEAVSTLYGKLSVLGRRRDGALVARSPLDGLAGLVALPGTAAVVCVLLGSTAYDGMSASPWWVGWAQSRPWSTEVVGTVGLLGMVLVVGTTYLGATWLSGRMAGVEGLPRRMPYELTHTIVPIALGYAVAHYYSLLVIVGQQTISALADPLGTGANWLGTAEWGISYRLVGATTVATVQVLAVVVGHVVGVVLAHDRTVALVPARHAVRAQVPVLVLMVFYTLAGLTLLFSA